MPMTAKEVLKLLHKDGWEEVPNRTKILKQAGLK